MKAKLLWFFRSFLWLTVVMLALDYASKMIVLAYRPNLVAVIPGFLFIDYARNTGAAWSIFEDFPQILAVVSLVAGTALLVYFFKKMKTMRLWARAAFALMIAGAWGNFVDRAFYPLGVVDFISAHFGDYIFPTFNVADSCLVVGIGILFVLAVIDEIREQKNKRDGKAADGK